MGGSSEGTAPVRGRSCGETQPPPPRGEGYMEVESRRFPALLSAAGRGASGLRKTCPAREGDGSGNGVQSGILTALERNGVLLGNVGQAPQHLPEWPLSRSSERLCCVGWDMRKVTNAKRLSHIIMTQKVAQFSFIGVAVFTQL